MPPASGAARIAVHTGPSRSVTAGWSANSLTNGAFPHATFHRHYADLIDVHFRPRIPALARPAMPTEPSGSDAHTEANLSRLRKENTDLRRTLALYEEAIRQLALENDALRSGGSVLPLPNRSRPAPPEPS
ncbi:hypothetical protein [Streptomyces plumbiresistens]|uniref:Transposase n=1 Tax=Streptomyces plumbiresistens TaxID=511811 RepID=A0ABP7TMG1_9ACTN